MRSSLAVGRLAVITNSGFSLAQARELVGYHAPLPQDRSGCVRPEQLSAQARFLRYEERCRKRSRFRHGWWRRIAIIQVASYYLACLAADWGPFVRLFKGMNLKIPPLTQLIIEPSWLPVMGLLILLLAPTRPHREDDREEEARLCLLLNVELAGGQGESSSTLRLSSRSAARGLLERIEAVWGTPELRSSVREWADLAEWELDLWHERRELRAATVLLGLSACSFALLTGALFWPLYPLTGCLC